MIRRLFYTFTPWLCLCSAAFATYENCGDNFRHYSFQRAAVEMDILPNDILVDLKYIYDDFKDIGYGTLGRAFYFIKSQEAVATRGFPVFILIRSIYNPRISVEVSGPVIGKYAYLVYDSNHVIKRPILKTEVYNKELEQFKVYFEGYESHPSYTIFSGGALSCRYETLNRGARYQDSTEIDFREMFPPQ